MRILVLVQTAMCVAASATLKLESGGIAAVRRDLQNMIQHSQGAQDALGSISSTGNETIASAFVSRLSTPRSSWKRDSDHSSVCRCTGG